MLTQVYKCLVDSSWNLIQVLYLKFRNRIIDVLSNSDHQEKRNNLFWKIHLIQPCKVDYI